MLGNSPKNALGLNPAILEALQQGGMLKPKPIKKAVLTAKDTARLGLNLNDIGSLGGLLRTQEHIPFEERPQYTATVADVESPIEDMLEGREEPAERKLFF